MKIIVAGAGKVGALLAKELAGEEQELTVIDQDPQVLEELMEEADIITLCGNCASESVLKAAGVEEADLLIVTAGADEVNLLCCMTARYYNPEIQTIARIRNPEYASQAFQMQNTFGLSLILNPEKQAAIVIERLLTLPGFLQRESFAKDRVEIVELEVKEASKLDGVALKDLGGIVNCSVLVCAVQRGDEIVLPDGNFVIRQEDRLFVTGSTATLAVLLKNLGIITKKASKILLAGGGKIGFYLASRLLQAGMRVKLIDKDKARCTEFASQLENLQVICSDATDQEVLERERLEGFDAMVSLTGLDESNIVTSLAATEMGVPQVITKISHMKNNSMIARLPIGSVIQPQELTCNQVVQYVRAIQNKNGAAVSVHSIAGGLAEANEYLVEETTKNCGIPLKDISLRSGLLIASIFHNGTLEIPNGDSFFLPGDTLIVVAASETTVNQLNDIFLS